MILYQFIVCMCLANVTYFLRKLGFCLMDYNLGLLGLILLALLLLELVILFFMHRNVCLVGKNIGLETGKSNDKMQNVTENGLYGKNLLYP